MLPFSMDELARMQAAQADGMQDRCTISHYSAGAVDAYGKPAPAWTADSAATACGLNSSAHREVMDGAQVVVTDAVLRLPIDTVIGARDRITVTQRFGAAITPQYFEVLGEPMRGPSGLRVNLRTLSNPGGV